MSIYINMYLETNNHKNEKKPIMKPSYSTECNIIKGRINKCMFTNFNKQQYAIQ